MAHCNCAPPSKNTAERLAEMKKAGTLAEKIRYSGALAIQDRNYRLKSYRNCFIASELVDYLVGSAEAESRDEAVSLGQLLVNTDYIHHVMDEHHFEDDFLFFRFRQDDTPGEAIQGPSAAYLRGQEKSKADTLYKKRVLVGWSQCYFVLNSPKKVLYQFRTELDSSPASCWSMKGVKVQPANPKQNGKYLLHFMFPESSNQKDFTLGTESVDTQLSWLQELSDGGVEILPSPDEEDELVQRAESIFDFEAKTIDGEKISLEKYRGHVTLIVNVASQ